MFFQSSGELEIENIVLRSTLLVRASQSQIAIDALHLLLLTTTLSQVIDRELFLKTLKQKHFLAQIDGSFWPDATTIKISVAPCLACFKMDARTWNKEYSL